MSKILVRLVWGSLAIVCTSSCTVIKDPTSFTYVDAGFKLNTGVIAGRDATVGTPVAASAPNNQAAVDRLRIAQGDAVAPPPPASAASGPNPVPIEACARFIAPALQPIPKLTEKQMEEIANAKAGQYNELLLLQIEKMYRYSRATQSAYADAVKKHLGGCKQVIVIPPEGR